MNTNEEIKILIRGMNEAIEIVESFGKEFENSPKKLMDVAVFSFKVFLILFGLALSVVALCLDLFKNTFRRKEKSQASLAIEN